MDCIVVAIEGDERLWPFWPETDVAIDVILDQRHVVPCQQIEDGKLLCIGHRAAERIVEARREKAGGNLIARQRLAQRGKVYPLRRIGRQLERPQAQYFERVQQAKVCGGLDCNRVAWARNGTERQDQRLGASDSNNEVVWRQ